MTTEMFRILFVLIFGLITGLILARVFFHTSPKETISETYAIFSKDWEEARALKKKLVLDKFKQSLFDLCDKESIFIEFFEDIYQLNEVKCIVSESGERKFIDLKGNEFPENKIASGRYVYLKKEYDTPIRRVQRSLPKILLQKYDDFIWTFAHEIGHHFTIQYYNNDTEEAACQYIKTLAEQFLTKEERELLSIEIRVFSGDYLKEKQTV